MLIKPTEYSVSRAEICSITKKVTKGYMWVTVRFDFMPYFFYNFYGATRWRIFGIFYRTRIHAVRQWGIAVSVQKIYVSDYLSEILSYLEFKNNVGYRIKAIRQFVGLTQSELAVRMKFSRKTIAKYENDFDSFRRVVSGAILKRFADALSVNGYIVKISDFV